MIGFHIAFDIVKNVIKLFCLNRLTVKIVCIVNDNRCRNNVQMMFLDIVFWQVAC